METVHETLGNGRFDMVALVSMMKDLRSDDCVRLSEAIQCGNTAVLQALACGDKSAMLAAAGIERHLSNTGNDLLREIAESGRDTTKEVCDGIRDTTREINGVGRDLLRAIECGDKAALLQLAALDRARCDDKHDLATAIVAAQRQNENELDSRFQRLHTRMDSGFDGVKKEISDLRYDALKANFEGQLRDKDNSFALMTALRDNRDCTKDENRYTREQLREEAADAMRTKYLRAANKYDELKSDLRQFERRDEDRRYTREVVRDAIREEGWRNRDHEHHVDRTGHGHQFGHFDHGFPYGHIDVDHFVHRRHHHHDWNDCGGRGRGRGGHDWDWDDDCGHDGRRGRGRRGSSDAHSRAQQNVRVFVDGRRRFGRDGDDDDHGHGNGNGNNGNGGNPHDD